MFARVPADSGMTTRLLPWENAILLELSPTLFYVNSEYVLWRKKWHAKGFGFTLRGQQDFKLEDFFAGPRT
jgi:hypothetical protein